jgi:hypothetical protein
MSVTGKMPVPQEIKVLVGRVRVTAPKPLLVFENGVDKTQKPVYITQAFMFYLIRQS